MLQATYFDTGCVQKSWFEVVDLDFTKFVEWFQRAQRFPKRTKKRKIEKLLFQLKRITAWVAEITERLEKLVQNSWYNKWSKNEAEDLEICSVYFHIGYLSRGWHGRRDLARR